MDLRNCRSCGQLFVYTGQEFCVDCLEREEKDFERVRAFVKETPGATVDEVAEKTGVERERIVRFLRQGRLESEGGIIAELTCEGCGAVINSGYHCQACLRKLDKDIRGIGGGRPETKGPEPSPSSGSRVYLSDRLYEKRDD